LGVDVHRSPKVAFAAALFSLALPSVAGAATKVVVAGPPIKKPPAGVPKDGDIAQFFPRAVKVHAGDTLRFQIAGFHAINFPKKGDGNPPLAIPGAAPVAGVNDAAGTPFWFNGQPSIIFNPAVAFGMKGTVTVVAKSKPVPSAKADAARVKAQLNKALTNLKTLDKAAAPSGDTITTGPDLGTGETLYRFTPATKTVKAGAPVTLEMSSRTPEIHTFTFAKDINTLKPLAQGFVAPVPGTGTSGPPTLGFAAQALYPSDVPLPAYDGNAHGDGYYNTGLLDSDARSPQPQKATMTFSAPGTYSYICLVHPDMKGKVVVTP
jgi:plastocyanin